MTPDLADQACVGALNLAAEGRVSTRELARAVVDISQRKSRFDTSHPTLIGGQALDCSLASGLLDGWRCVVGLRESLQLCYREVEARLEANASR